MVRPGSLGAIVVQVMLVLTQVAFAVPSLGTVKSPWPVILGLIAFTIAIIALGQRAADPLPLTTTLLVVALGATTTALVVWVLPDSGWPGYASWNFGAVNWLLFFLALRGRVAWAWIGFLVMTAITVQWAVEVGRGPMGGIDLVIRHAGTLLMGTLFSLLLHRNAARIAAIESEQIVQAANQAAAQTQLRERNAWAQRLDADVRPLLEKIAGQQPISDDERVDFGLLEVSLRDMIRGTRLASPPILSEARASRLRGSKVMLIDDSTAPLTEQQAGLVENLLLGELTQLTGGNLTARLLPGGREHVATIVREGPNGRRRIEVAALDAEIPSAG